jgi:hypothetical protein
MFGIKLRIHYLPGALLRGAVALVLLPVVLLAASTLSRAQATAPNSASSASAMFGVRQFYLTTATHNGTQALTACAEGYHFASIWEIADPSSLNYNTNLGWTGADSGGGPPTQLTRPGYSIPAHGWVRTGYSSSTSATAGQGNCDAWSSDDDAHWGTVANLPSDWTAGTQDVGIWNAEVRTRNRYVPVWCVQDDSVLRVFLPLVIKN